MRSISLAVGLVALAIAGCGGGSSGGDSNSNGGSGTGGTGGASSSSSSSSSGGGASGTIDVAADPSGQLRYTQTSLQAKAGKDTINFTNKAAVPHDVVIAQNGKVVGKTKTIHGASTTATVNLKPGSYTFYCSVPGHRQAGMQGTLTVK